MNISKGQLAQTAKFAIENGIEFIVFFGSRAKSKAREDSDFDMAVLTNEQNNINASLENYNKILFGLSQILLIPEQKLDIVSLNGADPFLKKQVVSDGILLYGDQKNYNTYKLFILREYMDMSDLRSFQKKMILKRQQFLGEFFNA